MEVFNEINKTLKIRNRNTIIKTKIIKKIKTNKYIINGKLLDTVEKKDNTI